MAPRKTKQESEFNEKLIKAIEKSPVLWNQTTDDYKRVKQPQKDIVWNKIGSDLGKTGKSFIYLFN